MPVPGDHLYSAARRRLLKWGGGGVVGGMVSPALAIPDSWKKAGTGFSNYGQPADDQQHVIRWISANPSVPGEGVSWTPLHELEGTITPNGLHFERHHNGVPAVDADAWSMAIHGQVDTPLQFNLQQLRRFPMTSRVSFIECGGNSNSLWREPAQQAAAGHLHGLVSASEWTGVSLSVLLRQAGLKATAKWLIVDALDAAGVTVSLPIEKCLDDVMIALYQNGEALRRENGYPARLLVPGWEGIVNVKWLHSLQLSEKPLWSKFDTVSYTDLHKDGIAERMTFEMGVKSVITSPTPDGKKLASGFNEISGLAWSGAGKITQVDVSLDGGMQWQQATLQAPVLDKALTRFRYPWHWQQQGAVLMSRALDDKGNVQPSRAELIAQKGENIYHHYNAMVALDVARSGNVRHVYA